MEKNRLKVVNDSIDRMSEERKAEIAQLQESLEIKRNRAENLMQELIEVQEVLLKMLEEKIKRLEAQIRKMKRRAPARRIWNAFVALAGVELHT